MGSPFAPLRALVAGWPPLLRDLAAAALALWSVCLGEVLILALPLPPEAMLALPGALIAWRLFGRVSAAFALLLAMLVVELVAHGRPKGLSGPVVGEALLLLAMVAALAAVCLAARLWARREARRNALLLDACAGDALGRIAVAEARLAETAAELARLRRMAEDPFEAARRSEGGV